MTQQTPANVTVQPVTIRHGGVSLAGDLSLPPRAVGLVLFAHGSGSSRLSPRNRAVAARLQQDGLATLLLDLLTLQEEAIDTAGGMRRFDVTLLSQRLVAAAEWVAAQPATGNLRIGCFGASTGAAAALIAAAQRPALLHAVVSRGGRPDLAGRYLTAVQAPTLLLVGERDRDVLELNKAARDHLIAAAAKELIIVPRAGHLFEEPGSLDAVASIASRWFLRYLANVGGTSGSEVSGSGGLPHSPTGPP